MSRMHLKSIRLEQFLQYQAETRIDELDSELCVIAGSNEAGKSTLLKAIRACLFDRYKSATARRFRPYNADVSPKVAMTFSVNGIEYSLAKTFSTKKEGEAILEFTGSNGEERKDGDEAEEYLAQLLDFDMPSGASKSEQQGLAGLLWVEQSKAYEAVDLTDNSRRRVQSVFETEMRDLLGGESGDFIHQRITELWSEYYGKTGPIGSYRKLFERLEGMSVEVDERRAALREYENKVDQLEFKQKNLQSFIDDDTLESSRTQLDEASRAIKQIEGLRRAVTEAEVNAEMAESKFMLSENSYTSRNRAIEDLTRSEQEGEEIAQRAGEIALRLESANEAVLAEAKSLSSLKGMHTEASRSLSVAAQIAELADLTDRQKAFKKTLEDAKNTDQLRRTAVANRDRISLTKDDLNELRRIRREADLAQAKLESAATSVHFDLESGVSASLDGKSIQSKGAALLSQPTSLEIEKVGVFLIKPGGEGLGLHKTAVTDSEYQLGKLLAENSMESLEIAETKWRERQQFSDSADLHKATLHGMAPDGISAIEDQVSTLNVKILDMEGKLGDKKSLDLDTDTLEKEISELEEKISEQEDTLRARTDLANQLREEASASGAVRKENLRQIDSFQAVLKQARATICDADLLASYTSSKVALEQAVGLLTAASNALSAENPEVLESEMERAERVFKGIEREIEELTQATRDLKVELSALGQKGLAEELAEAEGTIAQAQLEYNMADKQAKALDLLKRTLDESLNSAKAVAAKPITAKLVPYLKQLIPDANPIVDENMVLVGIERAGTQEPFESLSIGTREQLAVLIRLAYADLLSDANQPVTVILDDALVNSDDERRDQMKAILFQASKRYQIIILTCHGREYRDTGGQFIRLEEAGVM